MKQKFCSFFWIIAILPITVIGCVQQFPEGQLIKANWGSTFQLKIGQTVSVESENIKIKFLKVTEDSRCPSDVVCIWAGRATILINILKNDQNLGNFNVTEYEMGVNFDSYSIKLLKVEPYPETKKKRDVSDYMATLIVSKI